MHQRVISHETEPSINNYTRPLLSVAVSIQAPQDLLGGVSPKFVAFTLVVESSDPNRINPEVGAFQVSNKIPNHPP